MDHKKDNNCFQIFMKITARDYRASEKKTVFHFPKLVFIQVWMVRTIFKQLLSFKIFQSRAKVTSILIMIKRTIKANTCREEDGIDSNEFRRSRNLCYQDSASMRLNSNVCKVLS